MDLLNPRSVAVRISVVCYLRVECHDETKRKDKERPLRPDDIAVSVDLHSCDDEAVTLTLKPCLGFHLSFLICV